MKRVGKRAEVVGEAMAGTKPIDGAKAKERMERRWLSWIGLAEPFGRLSGRILQMKRRDGLGTAS